MTYRLGVDIGGTFTDFALLDEDSGQLAVHKQLATPDDPSRSVLDGMRGLLGREGVGIESVTAIVHGTTLVTNAIIERRGAKAGMITTTGFSDVLDMRDEKRYDLFDLRLVFPEPLIPRWCRIEVTERCRYDGTVEIPLDEQEVRAAITQLVEEWRSRPWRSVCCTRMPIPVTSWQSNTWRSSNIQTFLFLHPQKFFPISVSSRAGQQPASMPIPSRCLISTSRELNRL